MYCYRDQLQSNLNIRGKMLLYFSIVPDGGALYASYISGPTLSRKRGYGSSRHAAVLSWTGMGATLIWRFAL